jgi:hypothetical protein
MTRHSTYQMRRALRPCLAASYLTSTTSIHGIRMCAYDQSPWNRTIPICAKAYVETVINESGRIRDIFDWFSCVQCSAPGDKKQAFGGAENFYSKYMRFAST